MQKRILVVEDDPDIAQLIKLHLTELSYEVVIIGDGGRALEEFARHSFDLVVLDVMLPTLDGREVCKRIRELNQDVPIIMVTIKSDLVDKVLGLELGADDYLTKPFSVQELIARVKALLRRAERTASGEQDVICVGALRIDAIKRKVLIGEQEVSLTAKEFDLLRFLAASPGRAYTRGDLLQYVWGYESTAYEHTVDTHINRLRSKVEENPSRPYYILTVWGIGYRFVEQKVSNEDS